jgi:carbonic anhydrase
MSTIVEEMLAANTRYAENFGAKGELGSIPRRRIAVLTCMDCRIDPARMLGLEEGDAHIIRNAGARASDDAIRSLIVSYKMLGTREWFVIHHTNCGMATFTDAEMHELLKDSLGPAELTPEGWRNVLPEKGRGHPEAEYMSFLPLQPLPATLIADVRRIRNHPLVPRNININAMVYDVATGRLRLHQEASAFGQCGPETP